MLPSSKFYDMLIQFEGLKLKSYQDSAGIWTIGIGTIKYPNGDRVKKGETCNKEQAMEWAIFEAGHKAADLNKLIEGIVIRQNQFDALLSLIYNIGIGGFAASTLLKRIKGKPGDIRDAFMMWNKAKVNGVKVAIKGLTIRRGKEADLYLK